MKDTNSQTVFRVIREEGEHQLRRPMRSLFWSGVSAGVAMGMSVLGKAVIASALPDEEWASLFVAFGYTFGFLIVVLGRMQLFTEDTITTVLPVLQDKSSETFWRGAKLWAVVFLANVLGAAGAAFLFSHGVLDEAHFDEMLKISRASVGHGFVQTFLLAIPGGFLIAAMVWIGALARTGAKFMIVVTMTWLIGVGHFSHVVAGSVEVFLLAWEHGPGELALLGTFILPALLGNITGGTFLFSMMTYAQLKEELDEDTTQGERDQSSESVSPRGSDA